MEVGYSHNIIIQECFQQSCMYHQKLMPCCVLIIFHLNIVPNATFEYMFCIEVHDRTVVP